MIYSLIQSRLYLHYNYPTLFALIIMLVLLAIIIVIVDHCQANCTWVVLTR